MSQIIDASTRSLQQTAAAAQKTLGQLASTIDGQVAEMQTNQNIIADQQSEIAANEKRIETEVRNAAAEIRLQVKEDRSAVLDTLLNESELVAVKQDVLDDLHVRAVTAEQESAAAVAKAVKAAERDLATKHSIEITEIKNAAALKSAQLEANAKADKAQIEMLVKQVATLENTIALNREAETARTTALASSSVTVNNGKQ